MKELTRFELIPVRGQIGVAENHGLVRIKTLGEEYKPNSRELVGILYDRETAQKIVDHLNERERHLERLRP